MHDCDSSNLFKIVAILICYHNCEYMNCLLTCVADAARAHVFVQRLEIACGTVETGRGVAGILDRDFAEAGGKTDRAWTCERWCATPDALAYSAWAAVLAARSRITWVQMLTVFSHVFRCAAETELKVSRLKNRYFPSFPPRYCKSI